MPAEHRALMQLLKAYLLRELPEENAEAVELKYFQDRAFFHRVQEAESGLIQDYLDGRLTAKRRQAFEERYLQLAELRARVDAARAARETAPLASQRVGNWHYAPAIVTVLLLVAAGSFWVAHRPAGGPAPAQRVEPIAVATVIPLSPGLVKGSGTVTGFAIPSAGKRVALVLELPGARTAQDCAVTVFLVEGDGQRRLIWASREPVRSISVQNSQTLRIELESGLFAAGDYIVEATSGDGQYHETYVFRTNPAR